MHYSRRYWADRTPAKRRPSFRKFRGDTTADAVIIGGGLTGCLAAHVLARAGHDVVLLEADRLAGGATAGGLGVVLPEPDGTFRDIESAAGRRVARQVWKEARRSAKELATALGKLPLSRETQDATYLINARRKDDEAVLRREQAARRTAGLDAPWWARPAVRAETGTDTVGALKFPRCLTMDPVRVTLALARAAAADGARIHEQSTVRRTKFTRQEATVVAESGTIRTEFVLVATGAPGRLFSQLRRHVRHMDGYAVVTDPLPAAMRRATGRRRSVVTEAGDARHWLRWLPDHRAMFAGRVSKPVPTRQREKAVVRETNELMYELSLRYPEISGLPPAWGWDVPVVWTPDGLPWIGPHRNYPFHFFALAFGWHGESMGWLAARTALRHLRGEATREDDALGFARYL